LKVSIVIPTYKRADYLDRLLTSIQVQTFQDFEVIVVDDNSPNYEEYLAVVEKYKNIFSEFKFITKAENKGAPNSRNIGIKEAKYDLIALVDDDDEWLPLKLEKQVKVFQYDKENIGLVYTWTDVINENNEIVFQYRSEIIGYPRKEILKECFIPSPSVMVRKKAILESELFDESFPSCQDWDMWTRIIFKNYRIEVVREVLTIYHKHSNGNIGMSKRAKEGYIKFYLKNLFFYKNEYNYLVFLKILINIFRLKLKDLF